MATTSAGGCLTRYCEIPGTDPGDALHGDALPCPLCKEPFRPGGFRPNWQLASVVESIEHLQLVSSPDSEAEDICREHGEKVYFFCEDDETQLCVLCREAWEHRAHTVHFLDEAAGPYRVGEGTRGSGAQPASLSLSSLGQEPQASCSTFRVAHLWHSFRGSTRPRGLSGWPRGSAPHV